MTGDKPPATKRYGIDPDAMFDLRLTTTISELVAMPVDARSADWTDHLLGALWNGSVEIATPPFFEGPDGFTYLRLDVPRGGAAFDSNCLARQAEMLVATGRGAALFASVEATEPAYVLPMGVIGSMLSYDDHRGDPTDLAEIAGQDGALRETLPAGSEVLVGAPSRDFLSPHQARALHHHLVHGWGVADPRVALLVTPGDRPSRSLVLDRTPAEVPGDPDSLTMVVRMLLWYLPPKRVLALRPDWLKVSSMNRLADYIA
ncbi:hypothetical protein [Sphingomonas montana]|uniref:hypothetical protein n=1 Tax=Sphingomonas montana TaxID=1843236 RepID=UPI00101ADC6A|nr:hypothetical protein [Sphingomonas montana]